MPGRKLVLSMEGEEEGTLPRPSLLDGRISDEVWKNLTDYRRRLLIEVVVDRKGLDDKTRIVPNINFPLEAHFAPAPPGCRFKAMIPSESYWEFAREQQQEIERQEKEYLARREREREKRDELAREAWKEAMQRRPIEEAIRRRAMEEAIRQSRREAARCYNDDDDGDSKRPRLTTP